MSIRANCQCVLSDRYTAVACGRPPTHQIVGGGYVCAEHVTACKDAFGDDQVKPIDHPQNGDTAPINPFPRTLAVVAKMGKVGTFGEKVDLLSGLTLQLEEELTESNEYARKLNLKIGDLCKERDALAAQLERANEEIEVHKDRIQDLRQLVQEYRQCIRPGDLANLREE